MSWRAALRFALAVGAGSLGAACYFVTPYEDLTSGVGEKPDAGTDADAASDAGARASSVASFLATLGVCVHIAQGVDDPDMSASALAFAGFHNLRDNANADHLNDWIGVYQSSGVKMDLLTDDDIGSTVGMAEQLAAAGALLAVEGPSEPNNLPSFTYQGQTATKTTTFGAVAAFQRDLYKAVKADPMLAGIPVYHSAEAGGSEPDNQGLQFLTIPTDLPPDAGVLMDAGTVYADYANTHNYVGGRYGALDAGIFDNVAWGAEDPTLNGEWDGMYGEYGVTWNLHFTGYPIAELPSVPRVTTQTGWATSGDTSITLDQQGKVLLEVYLDAFVRGWTDTFVYMLRDDPAQGYDGFFDTSYVPKPSGTFLHNLTTILADSGGGAGTTGRLAYAIPSEPSTVHDLLLQK